MTNLIEFVTYINQTFWSVCTYIEMIRTRTTYQRVRDTFERVCCDIYESPHMIEFVTHLIENSMKPHMIGFVPHMIEFVTHLIEFVTYLIEFVTYLIEFVTYMNRTFRIYLDDKDSCHI